MICPVCNKNYYTRDEDAGTYLERCCSLRCARVLGTYTCPQCGEETEALHEGYCESCRDERQAALNDYNAKFDFWEKCTEAEKRFYIGIDVHREATSQEK